jgi:hypothetical protein
VDINRPWETNRENINISAKGSLGYYEVKKHKPWFDEIIILPVVLFGCETWALTLREEQRLRVSENGVLRGMFGPKRDEVTGYWRKQNNQELHNLYFSPDIIRMITSRRMRWAGHVARMGERGIHMGYWWESQKKRDSYEDQDVGGWTILKLILEI